MGKMKILNANSIPFSNSFKSGSTQENSLNSKQFQNCSFVFQVKF